MLWLLDQGLWLPSGLLLLFLVFGWRLMYTAIERYRTGAFDTKWRRDRFKLLMSCATICAVGAFLTTVEMALPPSALHTAVKGVSTFSLVICLPIMWFVVMPIVIYKDHFDMKEHRERERQS